MFDSESKTQYALVQEESLEPKRLKRRAVHGVQRAVVLDAKEGTFTLEVLGYEFPRALVGFDADWLVVRVTWEQHEKKIRHKGAILLADELLAWAERVTSVGADGAEFSFTEPNVKFDCTGRSWNGDLTARLAIYHDDGKPRVETSLEIDFDEWNAFGRALTRLARVFPQRSSRCPGM